MISLTFFYVFFYTSQDFKESIRHQESKIKDTMTQTKIIHACIRKLKPQPQFFTTTLTMAQTMFIPRIHILMHNIDSHEGQDNQT